MKYRDIPWKKYDVKDLLQYPDGTLLLCRWWKVHSPFLCELSGNLPMDTRITVINLSQRKYVGLSAKKDVEYHVL